MLKRNRLVILFLTVAILISYGQILRMNFWQDDNAVIFKFTHIAEHAGYLGRGIFGEGAYRYTITPYLPIFYIFGYNPVPYFSFALFLIIVSAYSVYFFYKLLFKEKLISLIAGFLYSVGYIASDGYFRLFNTVLTSISVVLTFLTVGSYYKYFKDKKLRWYIASVLFYLVTIELGYIRTHYLFLVIVVFEILFLFKFKNIFASIARLIPFYFLFDKWFLAGSDSRSQQVGKLITDILHGHFEKTYSFFGTLGNMLLSDKVFPGVYDYFGRIIFPLTEKRLVAGLLAVSIIISLYVIKEKIASLKTSVLYVFTTFFVLFASINVFSVEGLVGGRNEKFAVFFGIFFLITSVFLTFNLPKKKYSFFLLVWVLLNLSAYAAYIPIFIYQTDNRYLLHSLLPLVGLFALWAYLIYKKSGFKLSGLVGVAVVLIWGIINLYSAIINQQYIVEHRSNPPKRFFNQLMEYYPTFPKNSVFYFYIPNEKFAKQHYDAGFGVAQMPEETAIAWRYGVDRYDLSIVNDYEHLEKKIEEGNLTSDMVFAFIAKPDNLVNVTPEIRELIFSDNTKTINQKYSGQEIEINLDGVSTLTSVNIELSMSAQPANPNYVEFPFSFNKANKRIDGDFDREKYINFLNWQEDFYKNSTITTTTDWQEFLSTNLLDRDFNTYWEADRIAWDDKDQGFTINLEKVIKAGALLIKNGPDSLTPTAYDVYVSVDGQNFDLINSVKEVDLSTRNNYQQVLLDGHEARFVRVRYRKTIYDDSPGISEVLVVPEEFKDVDVNLANVFARYPFSYVESLNDWYQIMAQFRARAYVKLFWKTDNMSDYASSEKLEQTLIYDGGVYKLNFEIPASYGELTNIIIVPLSIPGEIAVSNISIR